MHMSAHYKVESATKPLAIIISFLKPEKKMVYFEKAVHAQGETFKRHQRE